MVLIYVSDALAISHLASVRVFNISRHGCSLEDHTEVTVKTWLVGVTEEKRQQYVMAKGDRILRLRPNESKSFDFYTKSKKSYKNWADDTDNLSKKERKESDVKYRGYAIRVEHEKGIAAFDASDRTFLRMMDPEDEDMSNAGLPEPLAR